MRVAQNMLDDSVAAVGFRVGQAINEAIAFREFDLVFQVSLLLVAKCLAVADKKLKITRVRLVHARVINFVDDAMAEREPDPAASVISGAEALLGAGSPARLDARRAKGDGVVGWVH